MRNLKGILGLLVIGIVIISTQNISAISQSQIFLGDEGSVIELTATLETTNLNEGEHVLAIEITLVSLGAKVTGIDFIIVYYRIGEYSGALDFSMHQLSVSTERLRQTTIFIYEKDWEEVMLEISILFFEKTVEEETFPENMHYYDFQPYFKVTPKRFLRENQYIFVLPILFVIGISHLSLIKLRKQTPKTRDIMFSCARCGFESKIKAKNNPHNRVSHSCPNCSFGKYSMHLVD
ncbi:MAG: hypothetical protein ACW96U_03080 [Candidatus Heimdallarchaeaceae archaeon]|jgi:hypothetical protein